MLSYLANNIRWLKYYTFWITSSVRWRERQILPTISNMVLKAHRLRNFTEDKLIHLSNRVRELKGQPTFEKFTVTDGRKRTKFLSKLI